MASLVQLDEQQIFSLLEQSYTAAATIPADTTPGSTLSSIFGAIKLLTLAEQRNVATAFSISRLATSFGPDVDSFVGPFGVFRGGALASSGTATFSLPSPAGQQLVLPIGTTAKTQSGLTFIVTADPTNPAYSLAQNGYVVAPGIQSVNVLVVCTSAGSLGNVQAGQISIIYNGGSGSPLTSFNAVTNAAAFTNGEDAETDAQLKARFTIAVSSGTVATPNALAAAVLQALPGATYSIGDLLSAQGVGGYASTGLAAPGYVTVPVNVAGSGSGTPQTVIVAVQAALNLVRSAGITVTAIAPTLVPVNVSGHVTLAAGYDPTATLTAIDSAIAAYLNGIGLDPAGAPTSAVLSQIGRVILAVPGVFDYAGLELNGGTANVVAPFASQIVAGTISIVTP